MDNNNQESMKIELELDTTGLYCPEPLFRVRKLSDTLKAGQKYKVLADDPAAEEDLSRWAKRTGTEIVDLKKEGELLTFIFKKLK